VTAFYLAPILGQIRTMRLHGMQQKGYFMIPPALKRSLPTPFKLTFFSPPSEAEAEFFDVIEQLERVAKGFARRRLKSIDEMFVDECIAEAYFVIVELIYTSLESIKAEYPNLDDRYKFYRTTVGYKLKEYWSYRATSTISFLKKKGISVQHYSLWEGAAIQYHSSLDIYIAMEHAARNDLERKVVELTAMGNPKELIAEKCALKPKQITKILKRVENRLKA